MPIRLANWVQKGENKRKTFSLFILVLLYGDAERLLRKDSQDVMGLTSALFVFRLVNKFLHFGLRKQKIALFRFCLFFKGIR